MGVSEQNTKDTGECVAMKTCPFSRNTIPTVGTKQETQVGQKGRSRDFKGG